MNKEDRLQEFEGILQYLGIAPLLGSDKQVEWGEQIRYDLYNMIIQSPIYVDCAERINKEEIDQKYFEYLFESVIIYLSQNPNGAFWIQERDNLKSNVIMDFVAIVRELHKGE